MWNVAIALAVLASLGAGRRRSGTVMGLATVSGLLCRERERVRLRVWVRLTWLRRRRRRDLQLNRGWLESMVGASACTLAARGREKAHSIVAAALFVHVDELRLLARFPQVATLLRVVCIREAAATIVACAARQVDAPLAGDLGRQRRKVDALVADRTDRIVQMRLGDRGVGQHRVLRVVDQQGAAWESGREALLEHVSAAGCTRERGERAWSASTPLRDAIVKWRWAMYMVAATGQRSVPRVSCGAHLCARLRPSSRLCHHETSCKAGRWREDPVRCSVAAE